MKNSYKNFINSLYSHKIFKKTGMFFIFKLTISKIVDFEELFTFFKTEAKLRDFWGGVISELFKKWP